MAREKLSTEVRDQIADLIGTEFKLGEKIPAEDELCARFNVSRVTLREAIKELTSTHVLEVRRGVGTFVTHHPGLVDDPIGLKYMPKDSLVNDIWETSLLLEPQFAAWTAERAADEQIEDIAETQKEFEDNYNLYQKTKSDQTLKEMFRLDGQFHLKIAKYTGNTVLYYIFRGYCGMIMEELSADYVKHACASVMKFHPLLIRDFRKHDASAAMKHMRMHDEEISIRFLKK